MNPHQVPYRLTEKTPHCPFCTSAVLWRHLGDGIWRWECSDRRCGGAK